jgi:hypothetical protein
MHRNRYFYFNSRRGGGGTDVFIYRTAKGGHGGSSILELAVRLIPQINRAVMVGALVPVVPDLLLCMHRALSNGRWTLQ